MKLKVDLFLLKCLHHIVIKLDDKKGLFLITSERLYLQLIYRAGNNFL